MVLKFSVESFRKQHTKTPSYNGHGAIYQHGDGVMVDHQELDQRSQDSRHTGAHGVQTYTVLSGRIKRCTFLYTADVKLIQRFVLGAALPQNGGVQFCRVNVNCGKTGGGCEFTQNSYDCRHDGKI